MNKSRTIWMLLVACWVYPLCCLAQDVLPRPSFSFKTMKLFQELPNRKMGNDTIEVHSALPMSFKNTSCNRLLDPNQVLVPVLNQLQLLRQGLSQDTLRVVHIGDSHVRGHIYPQTAGDLLRESFGAISYTDMGVNGATCLTFTHPQRIADVVALRPQLLILSFGTNESHGRNYNTNRHYHQMKELIEALRSSLPDVPILFTTPPGSYERFGQRRRRTYAVNPRTHKASQQIVEYATKNQMAVWDLYTVVGGKQRACKNWFEAKLLRPDHVHYLPEGYELQGELLYEAIVTAYNDYVSDEL